MSMMSELGCLRAAAEMPSGPLTEAWRGWKLSYSIWCQVEWSLVYAS